jgi:F-type H+-transporting ATPase subunit b
MRWSFFEPMARMFSERHKRAEGARSEAESTLVAAHEKERFYSDTVKKARGEIFVEQEAQRRRTLDQRQATITAARTTAQTALQEAKKEIAAEVKAARVQMERSSGDLANEIAEAVLAGRPSGPGSSPGRGAR